ncbi:DHHW family protein [Dysosmobacter sp.]|uniref:DHHW family protein n=1 Tax=Dysosmobacter sp. TaxID=2591382 RepID=UPI002A8ED7B4|nr:DHHW family protein [Dysosmobacter sp.]MDY3985905.1 DHHW family protein [Dysosmobacter sp.]
MRKFTDRAFLACLLAVLLAVPAGVALWSHKETAAYYENRSLAERPALTLSSLWDGSFGTAFESWYSDHAPGRTTLLKTDTKVQMDVLKRPVVNGIVDAGGVLVPYLDYDEWSEASYRSTVGSIADRFAKLNDHIEANGGVFRYVGLPEQRIYFEDRFPTYLNNHEKEAGAADRVFAEALADRGVAFLDMRAVYESQGNPESYYSAVDHHYNYYGAYAAYRAILEDLSAAGFDLPVLTEEDLDFQELPNPYIGSRNRKLYNLWPNSEKAVIGVQKEPVAFTRTDNGQPSEKPLFVTPAEGYMPTTYNLYMGGDFGETILETDRPDLPDVLIFGDSFTNALETLLYASFDETRVLDLRHYKDMSLKDYISAYQPDIVLCIQNDTFYYTATGNGGVWED